MSSGLVVHFELNKVNSNATNANKTTINEHKKPIYCATGYTSIVCLKNVIL